MLDASLLKSLLTRDFYEQYSDKLTDSLFEEEVRDLYKVIAEAHNSYTHDLTPHELLLVWKSQNPVATAAEVGDIEAVIDSVRRAEPVDPEVAADVIEQFWRRDIGKRIANIGIAMSEGDMDALQQLQSLLDKHGEHYLPDDYGEPTSDDIVELISEVSDTGRFKFNIPSLSRHVYGIGRTEFAVFFAVPETGKTAFIVSLAVGPGGFVDQGAKVLVLGNEESTKRTVIRACSAATGMTQAQIVENPELAREKFREAKQDRLLFKDVQDWDMARIEGYIAKVKPDVVVIDQADKVSVGGKFNAGHERLRSVYQQLREVAKRQNCALIGVSQASNDAQGKTRVTYDMMEGSKIGKAAEADLIIGIGKQDLEEDNYVRFLTVSKNKLSGWHGLVVVNIQPEISRYIS